ncbi:endonuclease/exonuclease/phosphatase family protein [Cellulomonas gelida]|uniref:Endonuclease/exonuclease/phosphatase domain-containing protein n=1 Tax=Cellulomonas gelida TaxID=1712 RepID=A0A4Y3KNB6_9CELL|nr:endonuclease/exonuclease/phosphatase family protein [Cellulomonas gelida]GEA85901.1 hypothetical protein CGE01nite_31520 [Cellulomonas gelida]
MSPTTGVPAAPATVEAQVAALRLAVSATIPPRLPDNLLIGTWNLRAFGDVSPTWKATAKSSPKRDWAAVAAIAAVVEHLDVVALQEVRRSTSALRFLRSLLGPHWRVLASDVTEGNAGNGERLAFLYDSTRVEPSGLVGEIVLPPAVNHPAAQFARTPYAVGFERVLPDGPVSFVLTTVHVLWGSPQARLVEIEQFAQWMRRWAERNDDWNTNLLVLGDFNLDRLGNPLYDAFVSTGLWPPAELNDLPRTIFDDDRDRHFYDQVAWFSDPGGASMLEAMTYTNRAGGVDFLPHVFPGLTRTEVSWRISDHYPLWVEFRLG